jgi:hypothetical protein
MGRAMAGKQPDSLNDFFSCRVLHVHLPDLSLGSKYLIFLCLSFPYLQIGDIDDKYLLWLLGVVS